MNILIIYFIRRYIIRNIIAIFLIKYFLQNSIKKLPTITNDVKYQYIIDSKIHGILSNIKRYERYNDTSDNSFRKYKNLLKGFIICLTNLSLTWHFCSHMFVYIYVNTNNSMYFQVRQYMHVRSFICTHYIARKV
jgi:hypothetical protein